MRKITNLTELKCLASENVDGCECFISLGNCIKSSKQIWYFPDTETWDVHNDIDDSDIEDMYLEHLIRDTNIIKALNAGQLFTHT